MLIQTRKTDPGAASHSLHGLKQGGALQFMDLPCAYTRVKDPAKNAIKVDGLPDESRKYILDGDGQYESEIWSGTIAHAGEVDSWDSVVHSDGVVLDKFNDNPIIFRDHGWIIDEVPIGRALSVSPFEDHIDSLFVLGQDVEPADTVRKLMLQLIYKGLSIGFNALQTEWEDREVQDGDGWSTTKTILHILKWVLWEYSVVAMPANYKCWVKGKQGTNSRAAITSYGSDQACARALACRTMDLMQKGMAKDQLAHEFRKVFPAAAQMDLDNARHQQQTLMNMLMLAEAHEDAGFRSEFADMMLACMPDALDADPYRTRADEDDDASVVQTLILAKATFETEEAAKAWVEEAEFKADKMDETETSFRFRQRSPEDFEEGTLKTIDLDEGVKAVVGMLAVKPEEDEDEETEQ